MEVRDVKSGSEGKREVGVRVREGRKVAGVKYFDAQFFLFFKFYFCDKNKC